jgi:predicted permease
MLSDLKLRLRALICRRRVEDELDQELQFHLAMETRKNLAAGMGAPEAERRAHIDFGGLERSREECRDCRGVAWIETTAQDIRYALRGFRRTPGFAATVVVTIAFALGLNTALFTLFNAYVLQPLAVRDPYNLYTWTDADGPDHRLSWPEFQDFQKQNGVFSEATGADIVLARVDGHSMFGNLVTGNYFRMLGVNAILGRALLPEDAGASSGAPVVVLAFAAWKNKFGGDPAIVGKKLTLRGYPLEVVGVAPPDFVGLAGVPLDFWAPLTLAPQMVDGPSFFGPQGPERIRVTGRLRPGRTIPQAEAELTAWTRRDGFPTARPKRTSRSLLRSQAASVPINPALLAAVSPVVMAFGLVLLIACANVANMMLARAMSRQREIGVRLAIGAGRARLVRQLLTESLLLALPAAAAGFAVSQAAIEIGVRLVLATIPRGYADFIRLAPHHADWRVFAFMALVAVAAALLFGLAPAMQATRASVMQAARGEFTTDFRPARLRNALVIAQVAASALFLICAVLLLRANHRFQAVDTGLEMRGVIAIEVQNRLRPKVLSQLAAERSVEVVAAASKAPLEGVLPGTVVAPQGTSQLFGAGYLYASPGYFSMFQVPIERGRSFSEAEAAAGSAVVVVSRHTAEVLSPGHDLLGQTLRIVRQPDDRTLQLAQQQPPVPRFAAVQVIGIARDAVNGWVGYGRVDHTCIYFPRAADAPDSVLFARVKGGSGMARRLDVSLSAAAPGAVNRIQTMEEIRDLQLYPWRALYFVSSAIGTGALLLTLAGIYGVLSYLVTQRTKEIGIRVALGAGTYGIIGLVLKQSLRLAAGGAGLGALVARAVTRLLATQIDMSMFGSFDAAAFAVGMLVVVAASAAVPLAPRGADRTGFYLALRLSFGGRAAVRGSLPSTDVGA